MAFLLVFFPRGQLARNEAKASEASRSYGAAAKAEKLLPAGLSF